MKPIDIKIKKELTEDEFKNLIVICEQKFEKIDEMLDIALGCEEKTKEITPANEAFVLLPKVEKNKFEIVTLNKTIPMGLDKESVLSECYKTKQPLMINDVTRSFLYQEKIDNFLNMELKDLLLIPILDDSNEKEVLAIIWAATARGSWNQYTQKDIDYMTRFSIFFKRFLQGKDIVSFDNKEDSGFLDCMDAYDTLSAKMRREQEYFSAIIHDVRTPMNAVMGFLELLSLKELDSEKKEYLDTALKSGETMVTLINDALDISKMASGKMTIEKVAFSPFAELSDVAKLFHNTAQKKNISFVSYYDPALPKEIHSDYHRIKQIMNNLLSNAIKFTPEGGEITLSLLYDEERDGLTVRVEDNGIGIAKEMQKNIFTPYTQEKSSTSREYGGTGLGLSISQQLSVLLGGKLQLKSEEGEGSTFFFTIPCNTRDNIVSAIDKDKFHGIQNKIYISEESNRAIHSVKDYLDYYHVDTDIVKNKKGLEKLSEEAFHILYIFKKDAIKYDNYIQNLLNQNKAVMIIGDTFLNEACHFLGNVKRLNTPILPHELDTSIMTLVSPQDVEEENKTFSNQLSKIEGKHILVVDDNTINLKFMREVLKTMEMKISLAQSGDESIEMYKSENIDLVFMDENMPGMQGKEAISLIRKREMKKSLKRTAIIGLTGDADKETYQELLDAGADNVLTKPIQMKEIQRVLLKYLS